MDEAEWIELGTKDEGSFHGISLTLDTKPHRLHRVYIIKNDGCKL